MRYSHSKLKTHIGELVHCHICFLISQNNGRPEKRITHKNRYCKTIFIDNKLKFWQFTDNETPHETKAKWRRGLIIWGTLLFTPCKNRIFKGAIWGIWTNCFRKLLFYLKAATSKMVSSDNTVKISTTFFRNSTLGKLRISIYNGPNKE